MSGSASSISLDISKGTPLRVMRVHPNLSISTMKWAHLSKIVLDPRVAEDSKALQYVSAENREQAALRNDVQREIRGTKKAENARDYAKYIADGLNGKLEGWSTPPFALWIEDELEHDSYPGLLGQDHVAYLPFDVHGVLVDAETQHLAHLMLVDKPEQFGIEKRIISERTVAVEFYHGLSLPQARQIFHDRNLLGVIPNKTVALRSDSRDFATVLAFTIMKEVRVPSQLGSPVNVPMKEFVSVSKRQLGSTAKEWMTLSTLRSFVVTSLLGRAGFDRTSSALGDDDLPYYSGTKSRVSQEVARTEILELSRRVFLELYSDFSAGKHTVVAVPAVFAAIGAVGHRSLSWAPEPRRTLEDFFILLSQVRWDRDPEVWDGVAGKRTPAGGLSVAGGVKDNGSKTATALEDPDSASFKQIRD